MADLRPKDCQREAYETDEDDYYVIDGDSGGTRKKRAFNRVFVSTVNDLKTGYVRSNATNGTPTAYAVGDDVPLLTAVSGISYAKIKVAKGMKMLVRYQNPASYIYAYPVLVDIANKFIAIFDTREADSVMLGTTDYRKITIPSDGYLIYSSKQTFSIFIYNDYVATNVPHTLSDAEKDSVAEFIGVKRKFDVFDISVNPKYGNIQSNNASGEPLSYNVGDNISLSNTTITTFKYCKIKVAKGMNVFVPPQDATLYRCAYPVLVDINNGFIALFDYREVESVTIDGASYKQWTITQDGYLIYSSKFSFKIYIDAPYVAENNSHTLSDSEKAAYTTYLGCGRNLIGTSSALFDYELAVGADHAYLRNLVECASNGSCTVLWDDNGYPSLMRRIPLMSIGALDSRLGDNTTPHPAFVVNGTQKSCIYAGVFMNSLYKGVPVSWFGITDRMRSKNIAESKTLCAAKGTGWHMETIWERSLISLLSRCVQGTDTPCGDNYRGFNFNKKWQCVQSVTGQMPGSFDNGERWIDGTQPKEWSHDNTRWGLFDIVGGYHEFCDLAKSVDGKIYLASDNSYGTDESNWVDTGAYISYDGTKVYYDTEKNQDTSRASIPWVDAVCSSNYDSIDESTRKNLALSLICPRLSSSDSSSLFSFDGSVILANGITAYPFLGGALEYQNSGLGMVYFAYDNTAAHNNMGSRLFFIE